MKPRCLKCGSNLQSLRTANSRFNKTIANVGYCPKCLKFYKFKIKEIKYKDDGEKVGEGK